MSYTFESPDLEILNLFIEEAVESSNQVEKEILKLETNADKSELINDVFRAIHSIKRWFIILRSCRNYKIKS